MTRNTSGAPDAARAFASFHPEINVGEEQTRVMCEMLGAVDIRFLGKQIAHLTFEEMRAVDDALELVLDLR